MGNCDEEEEQDQQRGWEQKRSDKESKVQYYLCICNGRGEKERGRQRTGCGWMGVRSYLVVDLCFELG